MGGAGGHHRDPLARGDLAVDDADIGDHAAVDVVDGVENHCARWRFRVSRGRRHLAHHVIEQIGDALARLARHAQDVAGLAPDDVGDLTGIAIGVGGGQVDLVEHRNDVQVTVERQIQVGQRLRLNALGGVDQQHRTLAGLQRTGHLVGEVDVPGGVDQVQDVIDTVELPRQAHVLGLDRDPAFPLDVHPVEVLSAHRPLVDDAGELQHPIGQRGLAVVDVGDDAEVPNLRRRREGLVGETADGNLLVKPGLGASRVSRDGLCSTIAGGPAKNETPGVILRGFVVERKLERWMSEVPEQVGKAVCEEGGDGLRGGFVQQICRSRARDSETESVAKSARRKRGTAVLQRVHPEVERVVELGQRAVEHVVGTRVRGQIGRVESVQQVVERRVRLDGRHVP